MEVEMGEMEEGQIAEVVAEIPVHQSEGLVAIMAVEMEVEVAVADPKTHLRLRIAVRQIQQGHTPTVCR